jgi:hypothetical protein
MTSQDSPSGKRMMQWQLACILLSDRSTFNTYWHPKPDSTIGDWWVKNRRIASCSHSFPTDLLQLD